MHLPETVLASHIKAVRALTVPKIKSKGPKFRHRPACRRYRKKPAIIEIREEQVHVFFGDVSQLTKGTRANRRLYGHIVLSMIKEIIYLREIGGRVYIDDCMIIV